MLKVVAFMKQVAVGLQMEGNFGTAHIYRSSLNAIIAYGGKREASSLKGQERHTFTSAAFRRYPFGLFILHTQKVSEERVYCGNTDFHKHGFPRGILM